MQKVLIADIDRSFCELLSSELQQDFEVTVCHSGLDAINELHSHPYHVLVMDPFLPERDGISVLQEISTLEEPPKALVLIRFISDYLEQCFTQLPVTYLMRKPCDLRIIITRIKDISNVPKAPVLPVSGLREQVSSVLISLGVSTKLKGYTCLKEAILLLIDDPSQPITKELYPAVAKSLSAVATTIQVERLMRSAIELAWNNRDVTVWNRYFPEEITHQRPSNRTFLTRIAESIVEGS